MKSKIFEFGDSLFLILMGLGVLFFVGSPEPLSPENTNFIKGVLADYPKEGTHDESRKYIGIRIDGFDDFYEFSRCSYNDGIAEAVRQLKPGDEVSFYSSKESSSTTIPWDGKKYHTYSIYDATADKYGRILNFEHSNHCLDLKANRVLPVLCGLMILLGIFRFVSKAKELSSKSELGSSQGKNLAVGENAVIRLKPDRLTYVLRNSYLAFLLIVPGIYLNYPFNPDKLNWIGIAIVIGGFYMLFHYVFVHDKIYYLIDEAGIHIKKVSFLFQSEVDVIRYNSIKEIFYKQAFYESPKNIGTILIDIGNTNDDGDKIYSKIIGVENYKEVARLILKRSGIEN